MKFIVTNTILFTNGYNIERRDCADIKTNDPSSQDGVYTINPQDGQGPFQVYCDMTTNGGGWTVFQRRVDDTEDFFKDWNGYKQGFGDMTRNFWLGNNKIHRLTSAQVSQLRIDMLSEGDITGFSQYSAFSIDSEDEKYMLHVSGYVGDQGDSLHDHDGFQFSTQDRDNDESANECAKHCHGAWWYGDCQTSNLNGMYGSGAYCKGLSWLTWTGHYQSLKRTEMKLKPS